MLNVTEDLINLCAIKLHDAIEHMDPQGSEWDSLPDGDREFYRTGAEAVLNEARITWARVF